MVLNIFYDITDNYIKCLAQDLLDKGCWANLVVICKSIIAHSKAVICTLKVVIRLAQQTLHGES